MIRELCIAISDSLTIFFYLSGLGIYRCLVSRLTESPLSRAEDMSESYPGVIRFIHIILTLYLCQLGENVKPAQTSAAAYYAFTYIKFATLVALVMTVTTLFSRGKQLNGKLRPFNEKKND